MRPVSDTLDKPHLGTLGWELGPACGWHALRCEAALGLLDDLGPAGGLLVGLGLSLVSDTSDRPGQQELMVFRTKKLLVFCHHLFDKNGPMELDADEPRKFQGPPDRILGLTWVGRGGGGWSGKVVHWRRRIA